MSLNPERDAEIVTLYKAGLSQETIGYRYGLTRGRVQQILGAAGVTHRDNPKRRVVQGNLYAVIGVNVTKATKAALRRMARKQDKSMSEFINELIEAELSAGK